MQLIVNIQHPLWLSDPLDDCPPPKINQKRVKHVCVCLRVKQSETDQSAWKKNIRNIIKKRHVCYMKADIILSHHNRNMEGTCSKLHFSWPWIKIHKPLLHDDEPHSLAELYLMIKLIKWLAFQSAESNVKKSGHHWICFCLYLGCVIYLHTLMSRMWGKHLHSCSDSISKPQTKLWDH